MSTLASLIYALLLRLVTGVQLGGFCFHHEGRMGRGVGVGGLGG